MSEIRMERDDAALHVALGEKLTAVEASELQAVLKQGIADGARELVFDFKATATLDSTGIGLLIATGNSLRACQGRIRLVHVSDDIMKLLQSMRLTARLNATGI